MKATIITIGDEILIGQIVDTNSVSIAKKLNAIGITIAEKISIGDTREAIVSTLDRALKATDVLIITGGLGPTKDDITKHTLAEYFGSQLMTTKNITIIMTTMTTTKKIKTVRKTIMTIYTQ